MQIEIETGIRNQILTHPTIVSLTGSQVYSQQAPNKAAHPFVVFGLNAGQTINTTANDYVDLRYMVKAVAAAGDQGMNAAEQAAEIAEAIRAVLHEKDFAMDAPWQLVRCQHMTVIQYVTNEDRRQYWHAGGIYRVRAYGGDL